MLSKDMHCETLKEIISVLSSYLESAESTQNQEHLSGVCCGNGNFNIKHNCEKQPPSDSLPITWTATKPLMGSVLDTTTNTLYIPENGYHKTKIVRGELGEISKIQEELDELKDAEEQGIKILIMCELADLFGAVRSYAEKYGLKMRDLHAMSKATRRYKEGLNGTCKTTK